MEPSTEFKFTIDEQYENEKGIFTVLSIDKDEMVIQWENGKKIQTEIGLQSRIQQRRQREKIARESKDNEARIWSASAEWFHEHGRNQLGGAVTNQLPTDNFVFNLWALAQKPEMHWTDCDHRNQDDARVQTLFFVRIDDLLLSYRICAVW